MNAGVVVDACVVAKWLITEEHSRAAKVLFRGWLDTNVDLHAPTLTALEVSNFLHRRIQKRELQAPEARLLLRRFFTLGFRFHFDELDVERAAQIAREFEHPAVYDAQYLALSERLDCEFWTADLKLWKSVKDKLPWVHWLGEVN